MNNAKIYYCTIDTPLGKTVACGGDHSILGLWHMGQKYFPPEMNSWLENPDYPVFACLRNWLSRYYAGQAPAVDLPLAPRGTAFQKEVWNLLLQIPYGKQTTYGDLAHKMAAKMGKKTMSAQAVGGAVGHNPISIVIPCHRVVGSDGSLTGYAGGIDKKAKLLRLEQAVM